MRERFSSAPLNFSAGSLHTAVGKGKVENHHNDVPFHILERKYSFDASGEHKEDNGSENMIIHGDNLLALMHTRLSAR